MCISDGENLFEKDRIHLLWIRIDPIRKSLFFLKKLQEISLLKRVFLWTTWKNEKYQEKELFCGL